MGKKPTAPVEPSEREQRLERALRAVEWLSNFSVGDKAQCPYCHWHKEINAHKPGCLIGDALKLD